MADKPQTIADYMQALPTAQRAALEPVLDLIRKALPSAYEEVMSWGMPTWQVPLATYPDTYNGQPLLFAGLAARKAHLSLYLSGPLGDPAIEKELREAFAATGKPIDMGASCIRFKTIDQLHLPAIAAAITAMPMERLIANAQQARKPRKT